MAKLDFRLKQSKSEGIDHTLARAVYFFLSLIVKTIDIMVTIIETTVNRLSIVVGDWVYYSNRNWREEKTRYRYNNYFYTLYKIRTDGSGRTKLNNFTSCDINVVGDWAYYRNTNGGVYKVCTDGSGMTKLNNDEGIYINVVDEWLYYSNRSDEHKLYKIRTDGCGMVMFNEDKSAFINVVGKWVYYRNGDYDFELYKIRTDGTGKQKVD